MKGELTLAEGWRKTDVSWRWSLRGLDPQPGVQGDDLSADEKKELGLSPSRLALRQGPFVSEAARQAGVRQGDVIVGVGGKALQMTGRQFLAHVRITYKVGDRVTYDLLRDGKRLEATLTLRGRGR
jgi:S1-C subfamily serine protease